MAQTTVNARDGLKIDILTESTKLVDPKTLALSSKNPREGDVDSIVESFIKFGFWGHVIFCKRKQEIIVGNHRVKAALKLEMAKIPVAYVTTRDDDHAQQILLADNRLSDLATYRSATLAEMLEDLNARDALDGTGYDEHDVEELLRLTSGTNELLAGATYTEASETFEVSVVVESIKARDKLVKTLTDAGYNARAKLKLT